MKKLVSSVLVLVLLTSCSGGGGESASSSGGESITPNQDNSIDQPIVDETVQLAVTSISEMNAELNSSETYKLEKDELDLLLEEGAISEEEFNELTSLLN